MAAPLQGGLAASFWFSALLQILPEVYGARLPARGVLSVRFMRRRQDLQHPKTQNSPRPHPSAAQGYASPDHATDTQTTGTRHSCRVGWNDHNKRKDEGNARKSICLRVNQRGSAKHTPATQRSLYHLFYPPRARTHRGTFKL